MIIGAAAQLNSGKDVLCDYLLEELNFKNKFWKRAAFANAVKNVYENSFGVNREFIEKWKRSSDSPPGMNMSVRKGLQFIGDGFRQIKSDIWIDIAFRENIDNNIIISDVRYINEAKEIKKRGGINILIHRLGFLNDDPNPSESQLRPLVEYCLKNLNDGEIIFSNLSNPPEDIKYYDLFLNNDGTLQDFYDKIKRTIVPLIEKFYHL